MGLLDNEHLVSAIYVGAVGARFERVGQMEWQDIVVTSNQNRLGETDLGYLLDMQNIKPIGPD
jgi:Domain of unknown function (DUF4804)